MLHYCTDSTLLSRKFCEHVLATGATNGRQSLSTRGALLHKRSSFTVGASCSPSFIAMDELDAINTQDVVHREGSDASDSDSASDASSDAEPVPLAVEFRPVHELCEGRLLALAMSQHLRLGAESPLRRLPVVLLRHIAGFLQVRIYRLYARTTRAPECCACLQGQSRVLAEKMVESAEWPSVQVLECVRAALRSTPQCRTVSLSGVVRPVGWGRAAALTDHSDTMLPILAQRGLCAALEHSTSVEELLVPGARGVGMQWLRHARSRWGEQGAEFGVRAQRWWPACCAGIRACGSWH